VNIHGGGFARGAGQEYDGRKLAQSGGIVVVTVNYRLGIFGHFDSDDDGVWENLSMWDIKLALEWVSGENHLFTSVIYIYIYIYI